MMLHHLNLQTGATPGTDFNFLLPGYLIWLLALEPKDSVLLSVIPLLIIFTDNNHVI